MTSPTATSALTADQRRLVRELKSVNEKLTKARDAVPDLTEKRRALIVSLYQSGIDTVQIGRLIDVSTETVRKNLTQLGPLRAPASPTSEGDQ